MSPPLRRQGRVGRLVWNLISGGAAWPCRCLWHKAAPHRFIDLELLPGLVADLRRRAVPHPAAAERVLATAHKAKGLEWPRVRLADDFPSLEELHALDQNGLPYLTHEERDQELHLLYVAATRARRRLEPNEAVRSCLAAPPVPIAEGQGRAA